MAILPCTLLFLLNTLVFIPVYLVGLLLVPVLAAGTWQVGTSRTLPPLRIWKWASPFWLWDNDQDGICPMEQKPTWQNAVKWYIRNPVENLRYTSLGLRIIPSQVRVTGNTLVTPDIDYATTGIKKWRWFAARQKLKGGLWVQGPVGKKRLNVRLGYKLIPPDAVSISPEDGRLSGCGVASQLQLTDW
jgi:hypothetical protein